LRADYDEDTVHVILDAMPVCHVGYVVDGEPYVTPTLQWREGDRVYWHGSSASRALRKSVGAEVCLTVTLLDGMVMARSAFHHSVNYRSVMIKGMAEKVTDPKAKARHLETMVEQLFPGRWAMLREMSAKEAKATTVLSMPLTEASAKLRPGMPVDDEEDYDLPIWAGVIPVRMEVLAPQDDPRNPAGLTAPAHAHNFRIG
jgi:nitroimidazol reductase NimA-like FMN-containing flavoprotein (pyridoxamine 5'-phosphate oxidase superfamily)